MLGKQVLLFQEYIELIGKLQEILDEGAVITFARFGDIVQVMLKITIDKEYAHRVNVDKIQDYFKEEVLAATLTMIKRKRESIGVH